MAACVAATCDRLQACYGVVNKAKMAEIRVFGKKYEVFFCLYFRVSRFSRILLFHVFSELKKANLFPQLR